MDAKKIRTSSAGIAFAILAGLPGCGGTSNPVSGKVVFSDGTPLTAGWVVFETAEAPRLSANGEIRPDGTFRLGMLKPGDGLPEGRYRAAVMPQSVAEEAAKTWKRPFDERYEKLDKSGLEFTVKSGSNDFAITLDRPKR